MNIIFNSLLAQLVKYDVHTTRKTKFIHAICYHNYFIIIILGYILIYIRICIFFARNSQLRIKQNTEQIQIYSKTVQHNTGCNIHT